MKKQENQHFREKEESINVSFLRWRFSCLIVTSNAACWFVREWSESYLRATLLGDKMKQQPWINFKCMFIRKSLHVEVMNAWKWKKKEKKRRGARIRWSEREREGNGVHVFLCSPSAEEEKNLMPITCVRLCVYVWDNEKVALFCASLQLNVCVRLCFCGLAAGRCIHTSSWQAGGAWWDMLCILLHLAVGVCASVSQCTQPESQ